MSKEIIDLGDLVMCDFCSKDWTDNDTSGGFLFDSKAVCPDCAPKMLKSIKGYNEEDHIKARCPQDKSFFKWVLEDLRKGDNTISVISGDDFFKELESW